MFPVSLLLTREQCDQVLTALRQERRAFVLQDETLDFRADEAAERAAARAEALATNQATVARLTPILAGLVAGTQEHTFTSRLLVRAQRRVEDLTAPTLTRVADPVEAFLKAVDARQVAVQVPELDTAIAEVEAHRQTLPA